jgi:hypothetical protein
MAIEKLKITITAENKTWINPQINNLKKEALTCTDDQTTDMTQNPEHTHLIS